MGTIGASWNFPRSPAATNGLVATGASRGVPAPVLLRGTGLTTPCLKDPDTVVQAGQELAVARNLLTHVGDAASLGVEAGHRYHLGSLGVFGFAIVSSATAREALHIAIQFIPLSSAFLRMTLTERGDEAELALDDSEIPDDVRDFFLERDITALLRLSAMWFGDVVSEARDMRFETRLEPDRAQSFATQLSASGVVAGCSANRAVFARRLLDQPLPTADPTTAQFCLRQCEDLLQRRRGRSEIAPVVRAHLLLNPHALPALDEVARDLGLSERTLRRRLSEERTSFRHLLAEVRDALATDLLTSTRLSVDQIARRLGYADGASFTRAFSRWHGQPPSVYRQRVAPTASGS